MEDGTSPHDPGSNPPSPIFCILDFLDNYRSWDAILNISFPIPHAEKEKFNQILRGFTKCDINAPLILA